MSTHHTHTHTHTHHTPHTTHTHADIDQTVGLSSSLDSCSGSTVYNGSTVTLSCSPDAFPPPSSISWLLNENAVVEGSNIGISQDRLVLTITSIYGNQSGQWVCRAENSVGTAEGLVELAVRGMCVQVCVCVGVCGRVCVVVIGSIPD